MTLTPEERKYLVESHVKKAERALDDAGKIAAITPGMSARASYDSAFHITTALFICEGLRVPSTHEGLNSRFYEVFVRGEASISPEVAAILGRLETDRTNAAYRVNYDVSPEEAENDLRSAQEFFSTLKTLVQNRKDDIESDEGETRTLSPEQTLKAEIQTLNLIGDSAKIYTKTNDLTEYKGKILHVDEFKGYSVQSTGKISLVAHKHDNLERVPQIGEVVIIRYTKNGKGSIHPIEREHKRN